MTDFPPVRGLLLGCGGCSEEHFNRKALRLVAEKGFLCQSLLPTSPSWMALCNGYIFSLSKELSALFSCEMTTVCVAGSSHRRGLHSFPWASRGQIDSVGLLYSRVEEILLGYCYPSKNFMSLSLSCYCQGY